MFHSPEPRDFKRDRCPCEELHRMSGHVWRVLPCPHSGHRTSLEQLWAQVPRVPFKTRRTGACVDHVARHWNDLGLYCHFSSAQRGRKGQRLRKGPLCSAQPRVRASPPNWPLHIIIGAPVAGGCGTHSTDLSGTAGGGGAATQVLSTCATTARVRCCGGVAWELEVWNGWPPDRNWCMLWARCL